MLGAGLVVARNPEGPSERNYTGTWKRKVRQIMTDEMFIAQWNNIREIAVYRTVST